MSDRHIDIGAELAAIRQQLDAMRALLPEVSSIPWQMLGGRSDPNRYWLATLAGKRLNWHAYYRTDLLL